jgi:hypothetical protein
MVGQGILHILNVYLAIFITTQSQKSSSDECSWYFTIFLIDLIPGLLFIILFAKLSDLMFRKCKCTNMVSGNYVFDNNGELGIKKCIYVLQVLSWVNVIIISKMLTTIIEYFIIEYLEWFSSIALRVLSFNNVGLILFRSEEGENNLKV